MNKLPNNFEEISLLKFLGKFQYLNLNDTKYFFSSKKYYKKRISNLISKKYIRKNNNNLVLADTGIKYVKSITSEYNRLNRNTRYLPRLLYISNLAAFYYNCETIKFIPSFDLKDRETFTITSRRYIGILKINGIEYLTYHISKFQDNRYISSVIYDIQKEKDYKNIIILVDDITKINTLDFTFGFNQVLIIEDNLENREKLKYLNSVNWPNIIQDNFKNSYISEYNFCDYTNYKSQYISHFYFFDTEKINRIKQFIKGNKNIDIICDSTVKKKISKEIPDAKYTVISLDKYIDRKRNIYE